MNNVKTHYRSCNICQGMYGLEIKYRDTEVLSIKADHVASNCMFGSGMVIPVADINRTDFTWRHG